MWDLSTFSSFSLSAKKYTDLPCSPPACRLSPTREWQRPFSNGHGQFGQRYLHHNHKQDGNSHNTSPTSNLSQVREQDRLILTLAGIAIALICSLVLLHDTHSMGRIDKRLGLGERSEIVPSELPVDIKKLEVASAIRLIR